MGSVTTFYDSSVTGRDTRNSPSSAQQRDKKGAAQTQHNAVLELSVLGVPGCMFLPGARAAQNQVSADPIQVAVLAPLPPGS